MHHQFRFAIFVSVLFLVFQEVLGKAGGKWVTTWGTMPQLCEPHNLPNAPFNETGRVFFNSTLRQTVKLSIGADEFRLRISNAFGGSDLPITAVTIALPATGNDGAGTAAIKPETLKTITFSGSKSYVVSRGALAVSDPIRFKAAPETIVTITMYLENGQTTNDVTSHPGSRTNSWMSFGNHVAAANLTDPSAARTAHWYFIASLEAWAPKHSKSFVIIGDSITDGRGSNNDRNDRWPDWLVGKMQDNRKYSHIAVVNQAAGGNRILADGLGPNVLARIERDVIAQSGVGYAMIYEGINDIGTGATTTEAQRVIGDRMIAALKQIAMRIHTQGIPIFAATITPFMAPGPLAGSYSDPTREVTRQRVNEWIRTSRVFDAVIDFDKMVRDPAIPAQLAPPYNTGDYLHLNVSGFQALANGFPLNLFDIFAQGVDGYN